MGERSGGARPDAPSCWMCVVTGQRAGHGADAALLPVTPVCPLPPTVTHGDFVCHPRPCERYSHGTVVEFSCDAGYSLTSDYKYITCQYGQWFPSYQVYCIQSGKHGPPGPCRAQWPPAVWSRPGSGTQCRDPCPCVPVPGEEGQQLLSAPSLSLPGAGTSAVLSCVTQTQPSSPV